MTKSYLVKSSIHFADFGFFVKVGDILVHDTSNSNRLTVYRNGEIVKAVKQTPLGIMAMVKNSFIEEVVAKPSIKPIAAPVKPAVAPKKEEPKPAPVVKKEEPKKEPKRIEMPEVKDAVKKAAAAKDEE